MSQSFDQIRRFPRIKVQMPVHATFSSEKGGSQTLRTMELGQGGCLLLGQDYFGTGRLVTLQLGLGDTPLRTVAKVLYEFPDRSGRICTGFQFLSLEDPDLRQLNDFIEQRLPEAVN